MTKEQIAKRLNELNQRGLTREQLRNSRYLATRKPLTKAESDEVVGYFQASVISDFSTVVRAELSFVERSNYGRDYFPCFRLFDIDGNWIEPSLRQATETRAGYVIRHLREAVEPEVKYFMRNHKGKVAHHIIPFHDLVVEFLLIHKLTIDELFFMVKEGDTESFADWHRNNSQLMPVTKKEHHAAHGWKKPVASEPGLFSEGETA